jgi:hypothetical protein
MADAPAQGQPIASPAASKLVRLLRRRFRQLLFLMVASTILLAVGAVVLTVWWLTSLNGLPDIGDPFDAAAFRSFHVPDDENAFTFFRAAQDKITPIPTLPHRAISDISRLPWVRLDPKLREWGETNGEAVALFLKGAAKADGISHPAGQGSARGYSAFHPVPIIPLVLLEGARREADGNASGAWDCYRAVLRSVTHLRRRGSYLERFVANEIQADLSSRLSSWAADPRTTTAQLRTALDDVLASEPKPEWEQFSLKVEYLELMQALNQPVDALYPNLEDRANNFYRVRDIPVPPKLAVWLFEAKRFLWREPDRSKRAVRLLFANWLAHAETPNARRQKPAVRAMISPGVMPGNLPLYPTVRGTAELARSMSPEDLAKWLVSARDLETIFWISEWPSLRRTEKTRYSDAVLELANELYRREHGSPPHSEEALVGTYLKSLPDDGSAEVDDGSAPTISGE